MVITAKIMDIIIIKSLLLNINLSYTYKMLKTYFSNKYWH